jgi:hypothetical protein
LEYIRDIDSAIPAHSGNQRVIGRFVYNDLCRRACMRTNPGIWSDEFEASDEPDFSVEFDSSNPALAGDGYLEIEQRNRTSWQRLEDRLNDRRLQEELGDWDDYLVVH